MPGGVSFAAKKYAIVRLILEIALCDAGGPAGP
jgi:hypothetical protein